MGITDLEPQDDMQDPELESAPPEESSNRTFLIVAAVLGGIMVLSLICLGIFAAIKILPGTQNTQQTAVALRKTENAATEQAVTATARALAAIPTATSTSLPTTAASATPSKTAVVAAEKSPTNTPLFNQQTVQALTATVEAMRATPSPTLPESTSGTGFADEVGVPGLLGLALVLVVVIVVARRLRSAG